MGICTIKGDNSKFIFARIIPLFGLRIFSEKAATTERWHPHAVLSSPFPTMFSSLWTTNLMFGVPFKLSTANASKFNKGKVLSYGKGLKLGPSPNDPIFRHTWSRRFLKKMLEKKKMLIINIHFLLYSP